MVRYSKLFFIVFSFILLIGGSFFSASAQPIWLDRSADKAITLEILKPNFDNGEGITFSTSAWFLTGRFAVSNTISVVGQIPFAHYGYDYESQFYNYHESHNALGNLYAGLEIHGENSPVFGEIGLYLPTAPKWDDESSAAAFLGMYTDLVDRAEAFSPEVTPIYGMIHFYQKNPTGLVLHFRGGPSIWLATGDNSDETELYLLYAGQVGFATHKFELLTGFSGRWWMSSGEAADNFGEASFHQVGFAGNFVLGSVRPGFTFRVPVDKDYSEIINFIFGLTLGIDIP